MLPLVWFAIQLIHPAMPDSVAQNYSTIIEREADVAGVDPLTFVTIIEHESKWKADTISKDGKDYGLMQVRAMYYGGKASWLLNPLLNIKAGGYVIRKSIEFCRKFLHREPKYQEWMACYQGSCVRGHVCKPTRLTKAFEDYQKCLSEAVQRRAPKLECKFN